MELDRPTRPDLDSLVAVFYAHPDQLARFEAVTADQTPAPYRTLLAHQQHMTVTVESFHRSPVDVRVLSVVQEQEKYSRRILLLRQSDRAVVQFGLVRLNLKLLDAAVCEQILSEETPLGRILIQNQVLREVELHQLYKVICGAELSRLFEVPAGTVTFGRTALIYCNGEPAVELLEIVAPITQQQGID